MHINATWSRMMLYAAYMFKDPFKITFRNFNKHLAFSFINVPGFAVKMIVDFETFRYTDFKISCDPFQKYVKRLNRLVFTADDSCNRAGVLLIALIKIEFQVIKAGTNANPVKSLRTE